MQHAILRQAALQHLLFARSNRTGQCFLTKRKVLHHSTTDDCHDFEDGRQLSLNEHEGMTTETAVTETCSKGSRKSAAAKLVVMPFILLY